MSMATTEILKEIAEERARQDAKWGMQRHPIFLDETPRLEEIKASCAETRNTCDHAARHGWLTWDHIFMEEYGEALEAAHLGDRAALRTELIQITAVLVASLEALDAGAPVLGKGRAGVNPNWKREG